MRVTFLILVIAIVFLTAGCCETYDGYGRYTLKYDCDKVKIGNTEYKVTKSGDGIIVDGHTMSRGIYRKSEPWIYLHRVAADSAEVTFDRGGKNEYPLNTGLQASINDVFANPWPIAQSTCFEFDDNYWLLAHIWTDNGVLFDLQKNLGDVRAWNLVAEDILVPQDGTEVTVNEINAKIKLTSFNADAKTATVVITSL